MTKDEQEAKVWEVDSRDSRSSVPRLLWVILGIATSAAACSSVEVDRVTPVNRADASSGGGAGAPTDSGASPDAKTCGRCDTSFGLTCCDGGCVSMRNDPHHCGACDIACPSSSPVCLQGQCVPEPCGDPTELPLNQSPPNCAASTQCCGNHCCAANEICCSVHRGGASNGLELGCYNPSESGGTCPIGCPACVCASPDTPIATPEGERPIASLRVGDLVYTVNHGRVTTAPLVRTNRAPVHHHSVIRVRLETGAVLEISALHPTADGRTFGGLRPGDFLDGVRVSSATAIPYGHEATYDVLPASDTGAYFASGVLVGSTLAESPALVVQPTTGVSFAALP